MSSFIRLLAGLLTAGGLITVVVIAAGLFGGTYTPVLPMTVMARRAGLVMNEDAKVKLHGAPVGKVDSIESLPDGLAVLHLAIDPRYVHLIPSNVGVNIASTTVFGAKYVELVDPAQPVAESIHAGQVLDATHVTVENNTVFEELTSVLSTISPEKLNQTLGAMATALNGRGQRVGQGLADLDDSLRRLDPSLDNLEHDFATAPGVLATYADAAPDLVTIIENSTRISQTILDEQHNLDALLVSAIGVSDIGTTVLGDNREALAGMLHLMVPTTDLLNRYHAALNCGIAGILPLANAKPLPKPGAMVTGNFVFGADRFRYPGDLPKVAATGGPQCTGLPVVPYGTRVPWVVTDVGTNPWKYTNPKLLWNSDGLKQALFGPIDGPPRNSAGIGNGG